MSDYTATYHTANDSISSRQGVSSKRIKRFVRRSTLLPFIIVGIVLVIVVGMLLKNSFNRSSGSQTSAPILSSDKRVDAGQPKKQETINKTYSFPLKDQNGKEVSKFNYEIQTAEERDEIIVKGEKATSIKGKTFLIINMKITNNYSKAIQLNVRDYIRLSVNGSDERLAPDIHNDPVEVQAISTKYTRVGFPINDSDKDLKLQIGEINGPKQTIQLNLK